MKNVFVAIAAVIIVAVGIFSFHFGKEESAKEPIESKTPIEPDLVIVISGGELDTTFVYRRK